MPSSARRRYFELRRKGLKGAAAARQVGVSVSCGSNWFIDAGSMIIPDPPISPRFLTQDDRIAIADGLRAGRSPVVIAAEIGKSVSTVYREIGRGRKENGEYEPWWAHNQALLRRQRPKEEKLRDHGPLKFHPGAGQPDTGTTGSGGSRSR
ncbi:helix-turn-helix domain-containing protein [Streptomyces sp. NBC_01241]|nr:helix-turn-helix domain-containing protein [Streptomyces sp. NBC_01241]